MSQHDFNIANQTAPAFRSDLNNALGALATLSSGATAPATTYANMLWYDETNNILKMRNEANSAWINLLSLNQTTNVAQPSTLPLSSQAQAEAGTDNTTVMTPLRVLQSLTANSSVKYTEFLASGTWTKPAGVNIVLVECVGGGGGGGCSRASTGASGGGGGGGFSLTVIPAGLLGATVSVTVGAGGNGATRTTSGATSGTTGGLSRFGTAAANFAESSGGVGGFAATTGSIANGGASGTSVDPSTDTVSGNGGNSNVTSTPGARGAGGGGGASVDTASQGTAGVGVYGGNGGAGAYTASAGATGGNGVAPGGGGGGASSNGGTVISGNGAAGRVRVWAW